MEKIFRDQFLIAAEFFETRIQAILLCIPKNLHNTLILANIYRAATVEIRHWLHYVPSSTTTMNTTSVFIFFSVYTRVLKSICARQKVLVVAKFTHN